MTTTTTTVDEARRASLTRQIVKETSRGWRVVSQTDTSAQLVKGKPTSHLLHLILSIITLGFWLPVWACVAIFAGEKHKHIAV